MKVVIKYDPENNQDVTQARILLYADHNKLIVDSLYDVLVRPYYKHGFSDQKINKILESLGEDGNYLMEFFKEQINELQEE